MRFAFHTVIDNRHWSRAELLDLTTALMDCAYGSGLLSAGELTAIDAALAFGEARDSPARYQQGLGQLRRVPAWAAGNVRIRFRRTAGQVLAALDPRAARFTDDMLRGSPVWMLGDTLRLLSRGPG